ncbi:MAG: FHA domain-containing protein [Crocinitomicaceae bacterium]|nr:FHA domain-containing protein [Crocinitomicaceae bacterium]
MAQLSNSNTGKLIFLNLFHIFGRSHSMCNTQLAYTDCSKLHATIFYKNNRWYFKDQSKNGTLIDNELVCGKTIVLKIGQKICFSYKFRYATWNVDDLNPPCSYLYNLKNETFILLNDKYNSLRSNDKYSLYLDQNNQWILKDRKDSLFVKNEDIIIHKGAHWKFVKNDCFEDTIDYESYQLKPSFIFELSHDYEHVNISILINEVEFKLGNKSQNYVLYLLAKKTNDDVQKGIPPTDIGWINNDSLLNTLSKELYTNFDIYYLNLQVYRIRKQLSNIDSSNSILKNVIERRKGQIRFNLSQITIKEPEYTPCLTSN